jgi:hypothetical protein
VLGLLSSRHPSLGALVEEQRDYILSSVQRLDAADRAGTERWRAAAERPVVLVVVGRGFVDHIVQHWSSTVDRRRLAARRQGLGGQSVSQSVGQAVGLAVSGVSF